MLSPAMVAESSALAFAPQPRAHIIDRLICERAPRLSASALWPVLKPGLYAMLGYARAVRMADAIAPLPGREALAFIAELLALKIDILGLEHLPASGRAVLIANHPTGIGDGIALWQVVEQVRRDGVFFANADAHRVCRGFHDLLIPVEWVEAKRTRAGARLTLSRTREALEAERLLIVFPAGRIARRRGGRLADPAWNSTAFSIARKLASPVIPAHMSGPHSFLFHLFDKVNGELRDITVFHELLNKRGGRFQIRFGPAIPPEALPADPAAAAAVVRRAVEALA